MCLPTPLHGYAAGGDETHGTILKTTDAGENWTEIDDIPSGPLRRIYFPTADTGYAVSKFGDILQTTDAGESWTAEDSGTTEFLFGLFFNSAETGYAVGDIGTILKTTNGGLPVGINEPQQPNNVKNSLKIYPNPATENITIELSEPGSNVNGTAFYLWNGRPGNDAATGSGFQVRDKCLFPSKRNLFCQADQ